MDVMKILKDSMALMEGHFILTSGLHTDIYVQCAQALQYPDIARQLAGGIVEKLHDHKLMYGVSCVVAPAMGGLIIGYEVARQLGLRSIFCEREDGRFTLRRGFSLREGEKVLVVEDVVTTGISSLETFACIRNHGGQIALEASIINRSGKAQPLGAKGVELVSLLDIEARTYEPDALPPHLQDVEAMKPGSRNIKK